MSRRLLLLLHCLFLLTASVARTQTNLYTFTANDGKFYHRIKILRVDDDGVFYSYPERAGGGRLKFSQLPEDIAIQLRSYKPREKTFADSLPAAPTAARGTVEAASSNRAGNGEKNDSAILGLTNNAAHAVCTFSRKVSTNEIAYQIAVTYYGTNYLGLGVPDSLTFDADGTLVTYSPVAGTHHVETGNGQISESQVYNSSLRDLQKICQAQSLGLALSGPLGNDSFAIPAINIVKNFGRYCLTNAPAVASVVRVPTTTTAISYQPNAQTSPDQPAEVLDANAKTIEDDPYTTQWAWKVTLRAAATPPKDFLLEFQFLDADGYVLAHEIEYPVKLGAGETNTLTGQTAIRTALSTRVKTCKIVMK